MPAHFAIWKILHKINEFKLLMSYSFFMLKISHMNEVSLSHWIKTYICYAKALYRNLKYEDSITLLRNVLDIFVTIPLEEIKFLQKVSKVNKISLTNIYINFDNALKFYSKYSIYEKNTGIFHFAFKKKMTKNEKFIISLPNSTRSQEPSNFAHDKNRVFTENQTQEFYEKSQNTWHNSDATETDDVLIKNLSIDSQEKLEEYVTSKIDNITVPTDSPCNIFRIYFSPNYHF